MSAKKVEIRDLEQTIRFELEPVATPFDMEKTLPGLPVWTEDEVEEPTLRVAYSKCDTCEGVGRIVWDAGLNFYGQPVIERARCPDCEGFGQATTVLP